VSPSKIYEERRQQIQAIPLDVALFPLKSSSRLSRCRLFTDNLAQRYNTPLGKKKKENEEEGDQTFSVKENEQPLEHLDDTHNFVNINVCWSDLRDNNQDGAFQQSSASLCSSRTVIDVIELFQKILCKIWIVLQWT